MIQINDRLMKLVQDKIINSDDFYVLLAIGRKVNMYNNSSPSLALLKEETNFGKTKLSNCINSLCSAGIIEKTQRLIKSTENNQNGVQRFASNLYTIKASYLE